MSPLIPEHGKQCMPCSANFSVIAQSEILSTETLDFLQYNITFLLLFLVIFKGNKNSIFPRQNIPFRRGNNYFRTL